MRVKWTCPRCGAPPNGHGKGGYDVCKSDDGADCSGFLCGCGFDECGTYEVPCVEATCYHCGWKGAFPESPKKALPWEKKALAAGWTPPRSWGSR